MPLTTLENIGHNVERIGFSSGFFTLTLGMGILAGIHPTDPSKYSVFAKMGAFALYSGLIALIVSSIVSIALMSINAFLRRTSSSSNSSKISSILLRIGAGLGALGVAICMMDVAAQALFVNEASAARMLQFSAAKTNVMLWAAVCLGVLCACSVIAYAIDRKNIKQKIGRPQNTPCSNQASFWAKSLTIGGVVSTGVGVKLLHYSKTLGLDILTVGLSLLLCGIILEKICEESYLGYKGQKNELFSRGTTPKTPPTPLTPFGEPIFVGGKENEFGETRRDLSFTNKFKKKEDAPAHTAFLKQIGCRFLSSVGYVIAGGAAIDMIRKSIMHEIIATPGMGNYVPSLGSPEMISFIVGAIITLLGIFACHRYEQRCESELRASLFTPNLDPNPNPN